MFDTIVNSRIFRETSVILFLNKTDLLKEKVQRADTDLAAYFPEFRVGGLSFLAIIHEVDLSFLASWAVSTKQNTMLIQDR